MPRSGRAAGTPGAYTTPVHHRPAKSGVTRREQRRRKPDRAGRTARRRSRLAAEPARHRGDDERGRHRLRRDVARCPAGDREIPRHHEARRSLREQHGEHHSGHERPVPVTRSDGRPTRRRPAGRAGTRRRARTARCRHRACGIAPDQPTRASSPVGSAIAWIRTRTSMVPSATAGRRTDFMTLHRDKVRGASTASVIRGRKSNRTPLGSIWGRRGPSTDTWRNEKTPGNPGVFVVRDTGIEPVTSSVSGKRATAAPIAPVKAFQLKEWRWRRDSNPCKRLCRPVPSRSATPPCVVRPTCRDRLSDFSVWRSSHSSG